MSSHDEPSTPVPSVPDVTAAAEALLEAGRREDALWLIEAVLQERPSRRLLVLLARVQLEVGTPKTVDAAVSTLERCRRFGREDPEIMALLRAAYAQLGKADRVRELDLCLRWTILEAAPARPRWPEG